MNRSTINRVSVKPNNEGYRMYIIQQREEGVLKPKTFKILPMITFFRITGLTLQKTGKRK